MASKVAIAVLALMVVLMGAPSAVTGTISCGQVVKSLSPCIPYLRNGGIVPPPCCSGVRSLNQAATTTPDRQAACRCLKAASAGVNLANAGSLPGKCGVNIGYPISPSVNCDTVK